MARGLSISEAVQGKLSLVDSTKALFSHKSSISFSASESCRPIRGVKSLSSILNGMITSSLVAGLNTKAFLVPSV